MDTAVALSQPKGSKGPANSADGKLREMASRELVLHGDLVTRASEKRCGIIGF